MARVKVNGMWFTKDSEIKEEVSRAFQLLLSDPGGWKPSINGLSFERPDGWKWNGWRSLL